MVISQQRQEVANLIYGLCINFGIRTTPDNLMVGVDLATVVSTDNCWLEKMLVVLHIQYQGSWARDLFESLPDDNKIRVVKDIGIFILWIVPDGSKVQAERDHNNDAWTIEAPPVMPAELVKMRMGVFTSDVLDPFRQHLEKLWLVEQIDQVECDHKDMHLACAREPSIKEVLDAHDHKTFFNDACDSVKTRFVTLRQFCGGLASMLPNTTSVESDFSMVKLEKDAHRTGLTSLSMAGVMHSKQFNILSGHF